MCTRVPLSLWVRGHARAPGAHVLECRFPWKWPRRGQGGGREGRAPRPLPGGARLVSWRGWFGCPSRMRPLALSGLRVVARVSEAHPGSLPPNPSPGREGLGAQRAGFFAARRVDFFVAFRVGDLRAPVLAAAFFVADFFAAFFVARPVVLRAVFFAAVFFAGLLLRVAVFFVAFFAALLRGLDFRAAVLRAVFFAAVFRAVFFAGLLRAAAVFFAAFFVAFRAVDFAALRLAVFFVAFFAVFRAPPVAFFAVFRAPPVAFFAVAFFVADFFADLRAADFLPEPDCLPPPSCLLTVAQAMRSAASSPRPRAFSLSSMCSAWRFCLPV